MASIHWSNNNKVFVYEISQIVILYVAIAGMDPQTHVKEVVLNVIKIDNQPCDAILPEGQLIEHPPPFALEEMVISQGEHHDGDVPAVGHELEQTTEYESKVLTVNELDEEEIMRLPVELVEVVPNIHGKHSP